MNKLYFACYAFLLVAVAGCFDPGYSLVMWKEKLVVSEITNQVDGTHFKIGVSRKVLTEECQNRMECFDGWVKKALNERKVCTSKINQIAYISNGGEISAQGVCSIKEP